MSSCFISDLHLDHKRENIKKAFFKFLESEASEFENLYILGDLFEVWIGDDFEDRITSEVISELNKFSLKNKNANNAVKKGIAAKQSKVTAALVFVIE